MCVCVCVCIEHQPNWLNKCLQYRTAYVGLSFTCPMPQHMVCWMICSCGCTVNRQCANIRQISHDRLIRKKDNELVLFSNTPFTLASRTIPTIPEPFRPSQNRSDRPRTVPHANVNGYISVPFLSVPFKTEWLQ